MDSSLSSRWCYIHCTVVVVIPNEISLSGRPSRGGGDGSLCGMMDSHSLTANSVLQKIFCPLFFPLLKLAAHEEFLCALSFSLGFTPKKKTLTKEGKEGKGKGVGPSQRMRRMGASPSTPFDFKRSFQPNAVLRKRREILSASRILSFFFFAIGWLVTTLRY